MQKKSKRNKYFWRLVLLFVVVFIFWERYPSVIQRIINPVVSTIDGKNSSNLEISWKKSVPGIETCTYTWKNNETAFPTDVFFLRFDPNMIHTQILYQKQLTTVKEIAESERAFAAINASFFDPNGRPLGLIVQKHQIIQRMPQRGMLNSGIFYIKKNRPYISHRNEFNLDDVSVAIQSFPRLIHNGIQIQNIKNKDDVKRRSGIAIDYEGNIIVYATDSQFIGMSLNDLQSLLLNPQFNIQSALNLDGGGSSQLYFHYNKTTKHITGLTQVPLFLGFFMK